MKSIPLTKGKFALVDDEDYTWLSQWKWYYMRVGYAARDQWENGKKKLVYMHRAIAKTPDGVETDHINLNKLDNRRSNLRVGSRSQNTANRVRTSHGSSGYKGVSLFKYTGRWAAHITFNGKKIHLGYFDTAIQAARVYDEKARELFGEFARTNLDGKEKV